MSDAEIDELPANQLRIVLSTQVDALLDDQVKDVVKEARKKGSSWRTIFGGF